MHAPSGLGGAVLGALVSLGGYVFFAVQAAPDGSYADGLWATLAQAPSHMLLAWSVFAGLGVAGCIAGTRLAANPITHIGLFVGLPSVWAVAFRFSSRPETWGGPRGEDWINPTGLLYAQLSIGLLISYLGLLAFMMTVRGRQHTL